MIGQDDVRGEAAQRLGHAVSRVDPEERAEDVGPANLALSECGVVRVVLDEEDADRGGHTLAHVYRVTIASAIVSASGRFPGGRLGWRTTWRYGWVGNRAFLRHGGAPVRHLPREQARASPLLVRRLVQQQPVEPDLGDGPCERLEVHRLDDVAVRAEPVRRGDVGLLPR